MTPSPTVAERPRPVQNPRTPTRGHPTVVLGIILVSQLMVMLDLTVVNVALPHMQTALGFTPEGLSWVLNAYSLTFGGLLLLGARAGDLLGRRRAFLIGLAVFAGASLVGGLAGSPAVLIAARTAQGLGGALIAPATLALLTTMFAEGRERTRALGLYTAVSIGGAAVGLVAGGMLTQWASWRWVMFVNVPIGLGVMLASALFVPETPRMRVRFDLPGALTSTAGVACLVYGFVHAADHGWSNAETMASFVAGAVLLAAFVAIERRAEAPITPLSLFADRTRSGAYLARMLLTAGVTGMFFFLTQFLQDVLGYSALQTGIGFLPITISLFLASQTSARVLVERFGGHAVMIVGIALSTLGLFWLTQIAADSTYLDVVGPLVVVGIGNGAAFVPLTAAALERVPSEHAGAASGLVNVMQQIGAALGLAVLVTVFGSSSRGAADHLPTGSRANAADHVFVSGAHGAFLAAALLLLGTLVVVAGTLRRRVPAAD